MLPLAPGCSVSQTPWQRTRGSEKNRALLRMEGWMRTAATYEFQLTVTNPLNQVDALWMRLVVYQFITYFTTY